MSAADTSFDAPFEPGARYESLDVLRGIAVLMIFAVNVKAMIMPYVFYENPTLWAGPHDMAIDRVLTYAVDGKWISVFALLFGAGLTLIWDKAAAKGLEPGGRLFSRQGWLLLFGFTHLFFVWAGDILTLYALVGMVAIGFLKRRTLTVGLWAAGLFMLSVFWLWGLYALIGLGGEEAISAMSAAVWGTDPEIVRAEIEAFRSADPSDHAEARLPLAAGQVLGLLFSGALPMILSYMLTGVVLLRTGYLLARRPAGLYLAAGIVLLAAVWALDTLFLARMDEAGWTFEAYLASDWIGFVEGPLGGLGYASLVMAMVRVGIVPRPLAAAGRMAFTNYILCSLIGTTVAYGHAGGLIGRLTLAEGMILVAIAWAGILVLSPLWLSVFRYGPLEWLWRSLTYGKAQPFLVKGPAVPA
jgi:uncharacterized protein